MAAIDTKQIISSLQEGGIVAEKLPSFELRKSQLGLLELIIRAFNENALLMAEAGTGVGKSFAYLLPAMYFALTNKEKVVISTATINLQQQLYEKDIPLVTSAIGGNIKSVLMKGRANYLCLRRLEEALQEGSLFDYDVNELGQIASWAKETKTGDRSHLNFMPQENVWSSVCSQADLCLGIHCPLRESCFITKIRQQANSAHIIVANHHLLFADLAARYQGAGYEATVILPPFSRLVIDEAHTMENSATSFFSSEFARTGIFRQLSRLYFKKQTRHKGLLVRLCALLPAVIQGEDPLDRLADTIQKIRDAAQNLDDEALQLCGLEGVFRLSSKTDEAFLKKNLFPMLKKLRKEVLTLINMIRDLLELFKDDDTGDPCIWEIKSILNRFNDIAEISEAFTKYKKHEDSVLWIERRQFSNNPWAVFTRTPLDLAPLLKDSVFKPHKTVCCVSATLAINDNFTFWASRCGIALEQERSLLQDCFPSPFPYQDAVLLASPTDAPMPEEEGYQDFINKAVCDLVSVSEGSALILFTSYRSLTSAYNRARDTLTSQGIKCLKQGDDDRSRLLHDFVSDTKSCLFATSSFWEGVDAPGDTLRLVIICRLPFTTPDDPVLEARAEAVEKKGGRAFMELSLPQAVMKFKQGFGRLMRKSQDHGIVAVLDSRLLKKSYGRLFLHSLPQTRTSFDEFNCVLKDMENFLY